MEIITSIFLFFYDPVVLVIILWFVIPILSFNEYIRKDEELKYDPIIRASVHFILLLVLLIFCKLYFPNGFS